MKWLQLRKKQLEELETNIQATLNDRTDADSVAASSACLEEPEMLSPGSHTTVVKDETAGQFFWFLALYCTAVWKKRG